VNAASFAHCGWPADQLSEAIAALAEAAKLPVTPQPERPGEGDRFTNENLGQQVRAYIEAQGLRSQRVHIPSGRFDQLLRQAGPAVLVFPIAGEPHFLALVDSDKRHAHLLTPEHRIEKVPLEAARQLFVNHLEAPHLANIDSMLDKAQLKGNARENVRRTLLNQCLESFKLDVCWLLCLPQDASQYQQAKTLKLPLWLAIFLTCYLLQFIAVLLAWQQIGAATLQGELSRDTLIPWGLLLLTQVPLAVASFWFQGFFNIGAARMLKTYLLESALRQEPDKLKRQGPGHLLARVFESDSLETIALTGGLTALLSILDLIIAFWVLSQGIAAPWLLSAAGLWFLFASYLLWNYYRNCKRWTRSRLQQSHSLTERMLGHRTRLAQEHPDHLHEGEDTELAQAFNDAEQLDRTVLQTRVILTRGWFVLAFIALLPALAQSGVASIGLGIAFGGILLAARAFAQFTQGFNNLAMAYVSWQEVSKLFVKKQQQSAPSVAMKKQTEQATQHSANLLSLHDLRFAYPQREKAVLAGLELNIQQGDRLILEGRSGSGKSTLAAMLNGLRDPNSGLILLHGLDRHTWGDDLWSRRVAVVSQYHDNHIFTGTLAFNLLMGRGWPTTDDQLALAQQLCAELGLDELLMKMPAGMTQMVGNTGWQLSHGERARVYIARALLQEPDLLVLDESFAALDPENLKRVLKVVESRVKTLLIIAHP
jgi:ATP-binding cassette subfamily B protein